MRAPSLALIALAATACSPDYKVSPGVEDSPADDTAAPTEDPGDTSAPGGDTSDPPDDEPGKPIAVCDVYPNPVRPPTEAATWDGSGSYDPDGVPISRYDWTLIAQPSGSTMTIEGTGSVRGGFVPLLGGTYTGQLIVTNEAGVESNPCTIDLEAIPEEDLWVEMYWSHSGDDMDLHMMAPGKTLSQKETSWDCYYSNCTGRDGLEWGAAGTADNAFLDLDDIPGVGPENINIDAPESSGDYTVFVNDYPGSSYSPSNDITVNIYIDGTLLYTDTKSVTGENSYTTFATITYSTRTVTGY